MPKTLPIPDTLLPRPRLIIWHGEIENESEAKTLNTIGKICRSLAEHGFAGTLTSAGGNDWSGWHLSGPASKEMLSGVAYTTTYLAHPSWKITVEP